MPNWSGIILTDQGRMLQAKVEAGKTPLVLTKMKLGSGVVGSGQTLEGLADLVAPKQVIGISSKTVMDNGYCKIAATISNSSLTEGYLVKELGVFADDPDEGEILYAVTTDSAPDYLPASGGSTAISQEFAVYLGVSNAANVIVQIDSSAFTTVGYVQQLIDEHNADGGAHLDIREEITNLALTNMHWPISDYRVRDSSKPTYGLDKADLILYVPQIVTLEVTGDSNP